MGLFSPVLLAGVAGRTDTRRPCGSVPGHHDQAAEAPAGFFLHRDFQSRNPDGQRMVICIIDFGGRTEPLAYDLASLLTKPLRRYLKLSRNNCCTATLRDSAGARRTSIYSPSCATIPSSPCKKLLQYWGLLLTLAGSRQGAFCGLSAVPAVVMLDTRLQEPIFQKRKSFCGTRRHRRLRHWTACR